MKKWFPIALRRLLASTAILGLMLLTTASTWNGNIKIVSYEQVLNGATNTFSFPPANRCGGEPRQITLTSEGSFRITMVTTGPQAGHYWITPVQQGTFEIPSTKPGEPTYAGRFELQADSYTGSGEDITFFLHLVGRGSDGSDLDTRLVERLEVSQDRVTIAMGTPTFLSSQLECA